MKTKDFLKLVEESENVEYEIVFGDGNRYNVGYFAYFRGFLQCVVKVNGCRCEIKINTTQMPSDEREKVIDAFIELMRTPPEEREEPKRYIFPLPWLKTTDGKRQYLTYAMGTWFACRRNKKLLQTWEEKDIKLIPEEYRHLKTEAGDD